jgi:hypothetical protein
MHVTRTPVPHGDAVAVCDPDTPSKPSVQKGAVPADAVVVRCSASANRRASAVRGLVRPDPEDARIDG